MGRSFHSPVGGTYFSTVLRPALAPAQYGAITPFAALAVWRAVRAVTGRALTVKWVNDLLLEGKKVCGILAESGVDKNGAPFVVLGIGINTGNAPLPPSLADIAVQLPYSDPHRLVRQILRELADFEAEIKDCRWQTAYRSLCPWLGTHVIVIKNGVSTPAVALDILEDGKLLVSYGDGAQEALAGGEISLRFSLDQEK